VLMRCPGTIQNFGPVATVAENLVVDSSMAIFYGFPSTIFHNFVPVR
jgi:hypothetical protein